MIFPGASGGLDDLRISPMAAGAPSLAKMAVKRLVVRTKTYRIRTDITNIVFVFIFVFEYGVGYG